MPLCSAPLTCTHCVIPATARCVRGSFAGQLRARTAARLHPLQVQLLPTDVVTGACCPGQTQPCPQGTAKLLQPQALVWHLAARARRSLTHCNVLHQHWHPGEAVPLTMLRLRYRPGSRALPELLAGDAGVSTGDSCSPALLGLASCCRRAGDLSRLSGAPCSGMLIKERVAAS